VSTRVRIALTYQGRDYTRGPEAIRQLIARCNPQLPASAFKRYLERYFGLSKQEKLLKVAENLPPDFALLLVREPRRTRKSRSLYRKLLKEAF